MGPLVFWRLAFRLLPACATAALVLSCGLADYPFVAPPIVPAGQDPVVPVFVFDNNPANNPEFFEGFELYYRFYLESERSDYNEDKDDIKAESEAFVDSSQLLQRFDYVRVVGHPAGEPDEIVSQEPVLPVPEAAKKERFTVELDFSPLEAPQEEQQPTISYAPPSGPQTIVPLRFPPQAGEPEAFDTRLFTENDVDMPDAFNENQPASFILSLYVLSYGTRDLVKSIYSQPVFLGDANINYVP